MENLLTLQLLILSVLWGGVLSSVDLAVHLSSYRNPSSATATGSACGSACNNTFNFCLQGTPGSCEYGTVNSSTVQSDNFSFDSVLSELNISNPLQFDNFTPAAAEGLQLIITIYSNAVEVVDRVIVSIPKDTVVSTNVSAAADYAGEFMTAEIRLGYWIESNCPVDTYGSGCSVFCRPQDNTLGHYFCNYLGENICLERYFQPSSNCSVFCEAVDSSMGHYTCDGSGRRVCLSGYTNPALNCTQLVLTTTDDDESDDDGSTNLATSVGLIIVYIFVGYFTILFSIVAIFCVCFVHCNCTCAQCCNSSYCLRPKCSPRILRKQRLKVNCPRSVATKADAIETLACDKCCPCCSDIDACDNDELAFWTELVILFILCLPFAICLLVLYAYTTKK